MQERGATVIVEQRSVVLSDRSVDVTRDAIELLNTEIGDGTGLVSDQ